MKLGKQYSDQVLELAAQLLPQAVDLANNKVMGQTFARELYTPEEAATVLRKSVPTLARWRGENIGPAFQLDKSTKNSRSVLYTRSALLEYVFQNAEDYPEYDRQQMSKIIYDIVPEIQEKLRKKKSK